MSNADMPQKAADNVEAQNLSGQGATGQIVDMASPDTRNSFRQSDGDTSSSFVSNGQMRFDNPYGGSGDHGFHDLGLSSSGGQWDGDSGGRWGGGNGGQWGGGNGGQWGGGNGGQWTGDQGTANNDQANNGNDASLLSTEANILQGEVNALSQLGQVGGISNDALPIVSPPEVAAAPNDGAISTTTSGAATVNPTDSATGTTSINAATPDPTAAGDQVVTALAQNGDPTLAGTLVDASGQMSAQGYGQLENYVAQNYSGPANDNQLMGQALTQAGLSGSDSAALSNVLQTDMPQVLASSGQTTTGSDTGSTTGQSEDAGLEQMLTQVQQIEQQVLQVTAEIEQAMGDGAPTIANPGGVDSTTTGAQSSTNGADNPSTTAGSDNPSTTTGSDNPTTTTASNPATVSGSNPATTSTGGDAPATSSNQTVASLEQADPTLATTLNAASSTMTSQGYSQLENYLATNNPNANPNLDSTLMSSALTQAGLSATDSTALQNVEIADMPSAQVLTYADENDPTLGQTLTDAAPQLSTAGYNQMENYLVNNYTGDQYMDSTLMNNVLNQAGLSASDQTALTNVLQSDMPTALASDPFAAGLQATDPTMSQTLTDASNQLSAPGYQQLETYVEDNYTGQTSSDPAIMSSALTAAGLSSADNSALTNVLQADMPAALTSAATTSTAPGDTSSTPGTGDASTGSGSGSGSGDGSGDGATTGDSAGSGNSGSTTTFQAGGGTLLEPPQSSTGLVTPYGSLSGDDTAYTGPIQGSTSGSNNITPDTMTTSQTIGPDTLQMTPTVFMSSMDTSNGAGFQQKYGYFVADIKVQSGADGWPGWYLESAGNELNPNDPSAHPSSEIDIMEAQTSNDTPTASNPSGAQNSTGGTALGDTSYNAGVHLNSSPDAGAGDSAQYPNGGGPADQDNGPFVTGTPSISAGYNTYGVNWQPNDPNIEFYMNGQEVGYNKVYDTTDSSPMTMILDDNHSQGWDNAGSPGSTPDNPMDVAWVAAYQLTPLVNSANDPNGTEGTTITDTNPADLPPELSENNNGQATSWTNTFYSNFTQPGDYTNNSGYTSASVLNSQSISEMNSVGAGPVSASTPDADNTPWYQPQWVVDQATSIEGVNAGMSTAAP